MFFEAHIGGQTFSVVALEAMVVSGSNGADGRGRKRYAPSDNNRASSSDGQPKKKARKLVLNGSSCAICGVAPSRDGGNWYETNKVQGLDVADGNLCMVCGTYVAATPETLETVLKDKDRTTSIIQRPTTR